MVIRDETPAGRTLGEQSLSLHVVKVTSYLKHGVDRSLLQSRRFPDHALPAATLVFVSSLADPARLLEVEATAVIPRPA